MLSITPKLQPFETSHFLMLQTVFWQTNINIEI
jgi:hypothetical protein